MSATDVNANEDPIARWKMLDEAWVEQNLVIIQRAFAWFMETGEWPEPRALRRRVLQAARNDIDVQRIIDTKPAIPGIASELHPRYFILGGRHLVGTREAVSLLNLLVIVTKRAVDVYRNGTALVVDSSDPDLVKFFPLVFHGMGTNEAERLMRRLPQFVAGDWPSAVNSGTTRDDGWQLSINEGLVMDFDDVGSPADYVKRQVDILRRFAASAGAILPQHQDGAESRTADGPAFVIMPFRELWSADTYQLIVSSAASLEPPLRTIRADKIFAPGRITEQIVEAIRNARLVIADITGLNANVMWELGYADALNKPVVILRQHTAEAPFDIYERRQVLYSSPHGPAEEASLRQHLRGALPSTP